jgi:hypothetical protein
MTEILMILAGTNQKGRFFSQCDKYQVSLDQNLFRVDSVCTFEVNGQKGESRTVYYSITPPVEVRPGMADIKDVCLCMMDKTFCPKHGVPR